LGTGQVFRVKLGSVSTRGCDFKGTGIGGAGVLWGMYVCEKSLVEPGHNVELLGAAIRQASRRRYKHPVITFHLDSRPMSH
jgi:hypothetical protein